MGSIRQFQRRAIESLRSHMVEPRHPIESIYSLRSVVSDYLIIRDARPLTILGISKGVGTCSDIYGMDVLVLSEDLWSHPNHKVTLSQINACAYAVLVRQASEKEAKDRGFHSTASIACVELLKLMDVFCDGTNFEATGHRAYYVAVV